MRTPQTCSNISHGKLQEHPTEDEDGSVVSHKICQSIGSSSSFTFSLQECIDELRPRKMHNSSQSNQNTDDDLIFQNNSNKKNERISKPCKGGFCYCFTSDSDDFRSQRPEEKRKGRKSDSTGQQTSDVSNSNSNVARRESFPLHSKRRHDAHHKPGLTRKVTAVSTLEDTSQSTRAPLIHIIQEIRNNCVVSEVRVNKQKIRQKSSPTKKRVTPEKKIINSVSDLPKYTGGVSEIESLGEKFQSSSLNTSARSSDRNGGRLLQKRLSRTSSEFKPRNPSTPPRKPPRTATLSNDQTSTGTAPSIREAEKVLDDFLLRKGISIPQMRRTSKDKRSRNSYSFDDNVTARHRSEFAYEKPLPSCPSLSDIEQIGSEKYAESCGVVQEQPIDWNQQKIRDMLNIDEKSKHFDSTNPKCGPQVGWKLPHKLDIDTVDGTDHNLVANITSKCTPVKSEMFNNKTESQKFILAEQLKSIVSKPPWSSKKAKEKQNIKKSNSFLNASKTKILRFVTKKTSPKKLSIGVQTGTEDENRCSPNLQSPPGSYFSNTPAKSSKSSQTEFDFSRTIQSPKREKVPQRKLLFPVRNVKETRLNAKTDQTYHSYNSDLDKDFTLSKMGQVLSNIKSRLEASDDHAVDTFRDIKRKEAVAALAAASDLGYDCVDGYDYQPAYHTSAQADIHNEAEPSYSEIEEDSLLITGSPVAENTNAIEHFLVGSDPKAIYAKINKTPKKSKPLSNSFNNVMEQNSPPKLRHVSKTDLSVQSEIFLENLTSETNTYVNRLYDIEREKVQNVSQDRVSERMNLDDSYATVDSFRETMDKDSDGVSYEYPDESINPIDGEKCTGNQSTPKKSMHLTKFGADMTSNDDLHHTESCPTTPGWLSNYAQDFNPREDSVSLQEDSVTNVDKPGSTCVWKYRTLKNKLSQSIRKSRHFLKHERKRITGSLNLSKPLNTNPASERWDESSLCLTNLFSMDENAPVKDQLTQAVGICRQYPELETSPEMVEAERLLLFSTLKRDVKNPNSSISSEDTRPRGSVDIKTLRLPIKENNSQEMFFNFYYIGVFSCGRHIKSTQSAECKNGEAIFRNCNIQFDNVDPESEVRCDIFMLRLRKVSTSRKPLPKAKKLSSASTSSEEILSRFRPHASFVLRPRDFVPYTPTESCEKTRNDEFLRLHASGSCKLSIKPETRTTHLLSEVHVYAEVEQLFKKFSNKGFLHVQDLNKKHSWNLRWCELDSLAVRVWNSPNDVLINEPVHIVDLGKCISNRVVLASRDVCARSRSFGLEFESNQLHSGYFFSADNQVDLNHWMCALNEVLEFIAAWMK